MTNKLKAIMAGLIFVSALQAQTVTRELPTTVVNNQEYYYYDVQPGETLFALTQRLGMSRERIVEYNPSVADGLKAYTRLYFPVETGHSTIAAKADKPRVATTHTVAKGETLYGISKQYGVSVDRIIELNASARDGIKTGDVLVIATADDSAKEKAKAAAAAEGARRHVIGEGETLYRIANDNGLTVEDLLKANPTLDTFTYSAGTEIVIPAAAVAETAVETAEEASVDASEAGKATAGEVGDVTAGEADEASAPLAEAAPKAKDADESEIEAVAEAETEVTAEEVAAAVDATKAPAPVVTSDDTFNIALLLPFMLNQETTDRSAEMFTDFYRGFLMGADTLRNNPGAKINIRAYDTAASIDTLKAILKRPEIADVNLFIGPNTDEMVTYMADNLTNENAFILNIFAVKNEAYKENPSVIQANIPHAEMYGKAVEAFMAENRGRKPVILSRIRGDADKSEFVEMLKQRLDNEALLYHEVRYHNVLASDEFDDFSRDSSYVFVPVSGSKSEFVKITGAIKMFEKELNPGRTVALFGYPEWLTFRGDNLETLTELNATIYSRFYNDPSDYPTRRVVNSFADRYGRKMRDAVPSQGLLGYDTAIFAINALRANGGDFHAEVYGYDGLQTDFHLTDNDCEGLVNDALIIIKFNDGGLVRAQNI